jgi:hypothetical protein
MKISPVRDELFHVDVQIAIYILFYITVYFVKSCASIYEYTV